MKVLEDFKKFALRGSLMDMAIGFTVGTAFSTIAKSLVDDIVMPPIGLVMGEAEFKDLFWVLKPGDVAAGPYATLADAQAAGAVTINYGLFTNNVIAFLLVALAMFFFLRMISKIDEQMDARFGETKAPGEPSMKKCAYCRSAIDFKATRCPQCTSQLGEGIQVV